jgi:hypothetical protein
MTGTDIDLICRNKIEYIFLVSLISSDNIRSVKDAERSLAYIDEVEEALKTASIAESKKMEFREYIKKGREILHADIERFNKEEK